MSGSHKPRNWFCSAVVGRAVSGRRVMVHLLGFRAGDGAIKKPRPDGGVLVSVLLEKSIARADLHSPKGEPFSTALQRKVSCSSAHDERRRRGCQRGRAQPTTGTERKSSMLLFKRDLFRKPASIFPARRCFETRPPSHSVRAFGRKKAGLQR